MGQHNAESVKSDAREIVLPPEELAILKERLETVDDAISGEELFAQVKAEVKRRAAKQ